MEVGALESSLHMRLISLPMSRHQRFQGSDGPLLHRYTIAVSYVVGALLVAWIRDQFVRA